MAASFPHGLSEIDFDPPTIRFGFYGLASKFEAIREEWIKGDREIIRLMASGLEPQTGGFAQIVRGDVRSEVDRILYTLNDDIIPFVLPHCDPSLRDRIQRFMRLLDLDLYPKDRYNEEKERWRWTWVETEFDAEVDELIPMLRAQGDAILIKAFKDELVKKTVPLDDKSETQRRSGKRGKPGHEKWRKAKKRMTSLLRQDKLPQSLRQTAKLLKSEGFTYSTVREAAHQSPTLSQYFKLSDQQDESSSPTNGLLNELAEQADRHTRQFIKNMTHQQQTSLEKELGGMERSMAIELIKTLAKDPNAGRTGDCPLIEESDQDSKDGDWPE